MPTVGTVGTSYSDLCGSILVGRRGSQLKPGKARWAGRRATHATRGRKRAHERTAVTAAAFTSEMPS